MEDKKKIEQAYSQDVLPVLDVKKSRFQNHFNRDEHLQGRGEENDGVSETVPDQSLSISELVYRYSHGMALGGQRAAVYDSDEEMPLPPDWDKLDISEKHDFLNQRKSELQDIQKRIGEEKAKLFKEQREKEIDEAVQRKLAETRAIRETGQLPQGNLDFNASK